eukprot:TRINITY_DN3895_c0_g2_i1.p1 TRINITY_DN3895_c0_g2~~TRINITY_DN3895_c0_g2_i1.p1  ORF type:complete len:376 (+),score=87.01 TRINITY_DN3895_c0_g2_i1:69-1196(+)
MEPTRTDAQKFKCTVIDIGLVDEGPVKSYVTYTIRSESPIGFKNTVVRRYSDFEWLQQQLEEEFPDLLVPTIPEKEYSLRFTPDIVQYRRREFGRFLERISSDHRLSQSQSFYMFLTADSMFFVRDSTVQKSPEPQISSFFSNVLNSVASLTSTLTTEIQEVDPQFVEYDVYLEELKDKFEFFHQINAEYVRIRDESIACSIQLATSVEILEEFEEQTSPSLAEKYGKLAETLLNVAKLDQILSRQETELLGDSLRDQGRFTSAPQRLLNGRMEVMRQYQLAQRDTTEKEIEKLQYPTNQDLVAELKKLKSLEEEKKQIFEKKSIQLKEELEVYKKLKFGELRFVLREVARENIECGEQSVAQWKEFQQFLKETE